MTPTLLLNKNKTLQFQLNNARKSFAILSDIKPLEFTTTQNIATNSGFAKKFRKNSSGGSIGDKIIESTRNLADTEEKIEEPNKISNLEMDQKIGNFKIMLQLRSIKRLILKSQ